MSLTLQVSTFPGGTGMTAWYDTLERSLEEGREYAALLLGNDPARLKAVIVVTRACAKCGGAGRRLKPRCKWTYVECRACGGFGTSEVLHGRRS